MAAPLRLAIKNAIRQARDAVDQNMNRHIADALAELDHGAGDKESRVAAETLAPFEIEDRIDRRQSRTGKRRRGKEAR